VPPPPYPLNFSSSGAAPRVLTAADETAVPLTIVNTGAHAWDPARIKVSYHWLWLVPRELAKRSRTVPFDEGIRTDLGGPVSPGAVATIAARLLAPSTPGVYWLQWDMVEENAQWFAQVSPRQSRRLVIIVPPLVALFAPLPFIVAIAAVVILWRIARGRRVGRAAAAFAATADVWWCAAVLWSKPLLLVRDALLEPTAVADWLTAAVAILPPLVLLVLVPRRARVWTSAGIAAGVTLIILGDIIYYRFFGDVLSATALLGARQTGQVWGTIRSLLTADLAWLWIDLPFAIWMAAGIARLHARALALRTRAGIAIAAIAALAASGVALSANRVLASAPLDQMFRDRAVAEQLGPLGYHLFDAWTYASRRWWRPAVTAGAVRDARDWFAARAPLRAASGRFAGLARGKNLIVVQVESLQDFAVDYRIDGQEVMPHLRGWTSSGDAVTVRFTNVTDQTSEGRTSDAEFAAFTSLLPLDHGAAAFRYSANHYVGFPGVLAEHGYTTVSAVPFDAGFWNRRLMHPSYGFGQSFFDTDFRLTEQIGWGLDDRDFLQQMVPRLEQLPRPFGAWLITLSLHHPYDDFPDRHKTLRLGALDRTPFGNYLHTMRFFDQALEDFKAALARDGLLDESLLVVFGDHDAGFAHDAALARAMRLAPTDAAWALNDRVPLFIRVGGPAAIDGASGENSRVAGQTDFAPTLLGLLGIDAAPLPYMGRNLLGAPDDPPVLRPYGDWIDGTQLFLRRASRARQHDCFAPAGGAELDDSGCRATDPIARHDRAVSRRVVVEDLQQALRAQLAVAVP
jgi:phosphoglycerol transferase MdoB-like AlkP superfamily enzyme